MKFLTKIFSRRPDKWAEEGAHYLCNPKCGYAFTITGRYWWLNHDYAANAHQWRRIGTWADLEYMYGDCSLYLERHYAKGNHEPS